MNRKIKFRVWDTDSCKFWNRPFCKRLNEIFEFKRFIFQQFTGLTDKNGKEIYEGDIIKMDLGGAYAIHEVRFKNGAFCAGDSVYHLGSYTDPYYQLEILGNILEDGKLNSN
jgi:hypothetical protein